MHCDRPLEDRHILLVALELSTVAQHGHSGQIHPGRVIAAVSGV